MAKNYRTSLCVHGCTRLHLSRKLWVNRNVRWLLSFLIHMAWMKIDSDAHTNLSSTCSPFHCPFIRPFYLKHIVFSFVAFFFFHKTICTTPCSSIRIRRLLYLHPLVRMKEERKRIKCTNWIFKWIFVGSKSKSFAPVVRALCLCSQTHTRTRARIPSLFNTPCVHLTHVQIHQTIVNNECKHRIVIVMDDEDGDGGGRNGNLNVLLAQHWMAFWYSFVVVVGTFMYNIYENAN